MTILDKLRMDLGKRKEVLRADRNIYTYFLKEVDSKSLIDVSYPAVLKGLERNSTLVDICVNIGKAVRCSAGLPSCTVSEAQVGWFICVSYLECGVLSYVLKYTYKKGRKSRHQSYFFQIKDWKAIKDLWEFVDITKTSIMPTKESVDDWTGPVHSNGVAIIKGGHSSALSKINSSTTPILFNVLNKLQRTGWRINKDLMKVYSFYLHNKTTPSPFKIYSETDKQKVKSFLIEASSIEHIALQNLDNVFYHMYNVDFRGRIYCNTAFLHEQSSDNAKGILLLDEGERLGKDGLFFLKVYAANCYGNDKISLEDRAKFINEHIELFLSYAEKPTINMGWIETDSPFSFLACCNELKKIKEWVVQGNEVEDYVCHLPIYQDGSCNGMQHLVAMSLDETIAPLVNLTPQSIPGDLYSYVAKVTWDKLRELDSQIPEEDRLKFDWMMTTVKSLQKAYNDAPDKSEQKAQAYERVQEWRNQHRDLREKLFPMYWLKIDSLKEQRKIVKRNTMTLSYGGTPYGFGQQIIEDTKDFSDYLRDKEHLHAAMLGNLVFKTCYEMLPGPGKLLTMFEELAERTNSQDCFLRWTVPVTNFPVVQSYRDPATVRTKLKYGEDELYVNIQTWNEASVKKSSQKTGAAPNLVHSFDAAHLTITVNAADFPMTVVHDSFGCTPGHMSKLFTLVREKFVEFYNVAPLETVLAELDGLDLLPPKGNLNLSGVIDSDFAFC